MAEWLDRRPGLRDAAAQWTGQLPQRLDEADRRGRSLVHVAPLTAGSLPRLAALVRDAAPRLALPLARQDGDGIVDAIADIALHGGPTFVKLGQFLSTVKGVVPDWVAGAFVRCRDDVPPASSDAVERMMHKSGIGDRLRSWDRRPMASASVAQVHQAELRDGREVVVKLRRPGIVRTVRADAAYLFPAFAVVEAADDRFRMANLRGALALMIRLFAQEVDLRIEAANAVQMALAFERAGVVVQVPAPIPGFVTKRVMVMERVPGVSAGDTAGAIAFGHAARDLVRLAVAGTLETTLVDGIFHGDLHPGNMLVNDDGLALIDYGIVGRLSERQRQSLATLLVAAVSEDRHGIVEGLVGFGALPEGIEAAAFLDLLPEVTLEERNAMLRDPSQFDEHFQRVLVALRTSGFRVPPELVLFGRNVVYLADAVERFAPDLDLIAEVGSIIIEMAARHPFSA